MARKDIGNYRDENRRGIVFIALVLWIIGFATLVLGLIHIPTEYGVWALVLAGAILIIGSIVEGL